MKNTPFMPLLMTRQYLDIYDARYIVTYPAIKTIARHKKFLKLILSHQINTPQWHLKVEMYKSVGLVD